MAKIITNPNLRDQVYNIIIKMITKRELRLGEKINEERLAQEIGVSRTPVREALFRLENESIVEIIPRRGPFVVKLTEQMLKEIFEIREVLEGLVVRLATPLLDKKTIRKIRGVLDKIDATSDEEQNLTKYTNHDIEFHRLLLESCNNQMLTNMMGTINSHLQIIRLRTVGFPGRAKKTVSEHYKILAAIEKKDHLTAEKLMQQHISSVRKSALQNIEAMI